MSYCSIGDLRRYLQFTPIKVNSDKIDVQKIDEAELEKIIIPKPKKYKRKIGDQREEIGFIAEELPELIRHRNGYDLKALVAILAWKITRIEELLGKNSR